MNREIKFRAWYEGKMLNDISDGMMIQMNSGKCGVYDEDWQSYDDIVLMQYTGLKDRNGEDIYEGDIVKKQDPKYWYESIGEDEPDPPDAEDIFFYRGGTAQVVAVEFGYYMQEIDCGEWCFNGPEGREWRSFEIEVVGNIYENPELTASPPAQHPHDK